MRGEGTGIYTSRMNERFSLACIALKRSIEVVFSEVKYPFFQEVNYA